MSIRKGTAGVRLLDDHSEDDAVLCCQRRGRNEFLAVATVLDRETVIKWWKADEITDGQLGDLHLAVTQEESVTAKPDYPRADDIRKIAAKAAEEAAREDAT